MVHPAPACCKSASSNMHNTFVQAYSHTLYTHWAFKYLFVQLRADRKTKIVDLECLVRLLYVQTHVWINVSMYMINLRIWTVRKACRMSLLTVNLHACYFAQCACKVREIYILLWLFEIIGVCFLLHGYVGVNRSPPSAVAWYNKCVCQSHPESMHRRASHMSTCTQQNQMNKTSMHMRERGKEKFCTQWIQRTHKQVTYKLMHAEHMILTHVCSGACVNLIVVGKFGDFSHWKVVKAHVGAVVQNGEILPDTHGRKSEQHKSFARPGFVYVIQQRLLMSTTARVGCGQAP